MTKPVMTMENWHYSSTVVEVIRTVFFLFIKIFCTHTKKTHKLYSNISIHLKSIIKNTSNFHSDAKQ